MELACEWVSGSLWQLNPYQCSENCVAISDVCWALSYVRGEELVTQPQHWPLPACWGLWKAARRNGKEERMSEVFPFLLVQITQGSWSLDLRSSLRLCSTAHSVPQSHGAALLLCPKDSQGLTAGTASSAADHKDKTRWSGRGIHFKPSFARVEPSLFLPQPTSSNSILQDHLGWGKRILQLSCWSCQDQKEHYLCHRRLVFQCCMHILLCVSLMQNSETVRLQEFVSCLGFWYMQHIQLEL